MKVEELAKIQRRQEKLKDNFDDAEVCLISLFIVLGFIACAGKV